MPKSSRSYLILVVAAALLNVMINASPAQPSPGDKLMQFVYVLRLVPRLYAEASWTKEDSEVLSRHLARFKEAAAKGQLILAGRTLTPGAQTFGVAIFEAEDEAAARAFMEGDPAVAGGLMTAELHPFRVAVQGKGQ